ncbi:MAG: hypothetical protein ACLQFR_32305 [Streptosporangiaceae bacterium]
MSGLHVTMWAWAAIGTGLSPTVIGGVLVTVTITSLLAGLRASPGRGPAAQASPSRDHLARFASPRPRRQARGEQSQAEAELQNEASLVTVPFPRSPSP